MPVEKQPLWFFALCASEGVLALAFLFLIPSEVGVLSPARLTLGAGTLALTAGCAYWGWRPAQGMRMLKHHSAVPAAALLSLCFGLILFLLRFLSPEHLLPYYVRLAPVLWYMFILSLQAAVFSLVLQNRFHPEFLRKNRPLYAASGVFLGILLVFLMVVVFTGIGVTKDAAYWGEPGVAIPFWLFGLAILLGAGFLVHELGMPNPDPRRLLDRLTPAFIWLAASALWLSVPISRLKNSFYAPITPPYATPFPYSDAGFYDYLSQSLLVGADYFGGIPPRPLYVTFLAFLHLLFGQDYVRIIAAQTLVFALFPVALYLLGSKLHSRAAGITVAFLAIFRELTTLWISSNTRTASTKTFVTDFPTALAIAFTCLVVIRWFERRDTKSALIAGGSFGLLLLLRTQSLIILPVLFVVAFFVHQKDIRAWVRAGITFGAAMALTLAPWLIHNYIVTGSFAFDDPAQMAVIYSQYSFNDNLDISQFDLQTESLGRRLISFTLGNPGFVGGFIANHFLNTEIGGLLALPLIEKFNGLLSPVNLYWIDWNGSLAWYNFALILFYLAVIAVGLGAAWARWKWIGLVPLAFNIGYALANGISRFSSWRYNLPVDWIVYFYLGMGVIELFMLVAGLFGWEAVRVAPVGTPELKMERLKPATLVHVLAFVFIGSLPWLAEGMVPPRYADQSVPAIAQKAGSVSSAPSAAEIEAFASRPETYVGVGRVLYPRFFPRDKGLASANPWPNYAVRDFPRFGFLLINQDFLFMVFPARGDSATIPHAAEAVVLGCLRADHVEARLIVLPELNVKYASAPLTEPCSP